MNSVTVTPTAITIWNAIGLEGSDEFDLVGLGRAIQAHVVEATMDQTVQDDGSYTVLLHYACAPDQEDSLRDAVCAYLEQ